MGEREGGDDAVLTVSVGYVSPVICGLFSFRILRYGVILSLNFTALAAHFGATAYGLHLGGAYIAENVPCV